VREIKVRVILPMPFLLYLFLPLFLAGASKLSATIMPPCSSCLQSWAACRDSASDTVENWVSRFPIFNPNPPDLGSFLKACIVKCKVLNIFIGY